jgi:hypothetical protein
MYVNAKMIPGETVPGIRGGGNSSMIYLIHCKNFCKCYNVPPLSTTIKKKKKDEHTKKYINQKINFVQ